MPPSKKELRKISKALRRSEGGSNVSTVSSRLTLPKGTEDGTAISVDASAESNADQPRVIESRKSSVARSLSETFADLAIQRPPVSLIKQEQTSNNVATIRPSAPRHSLLGSDPFFDNNGQTAPEGSGALGKLNKLLNDSRAVIREKQTAVSASSTPRSNTSMKELVSQGSLQTPRKDWLKPAETLAQSPYATHRKFLSIEEFPPLPSSKSESPQEERQSSPELPTTSDDLHDESSHTPGESADTPSTPLELHDVWTESPQKEHQPSPGPQSIFDDLRDQSRYSPGESADPPSTPIELRDVQPGTHFPLSLDGTHDRKSISSLGSGYLADIDGGSSAKQLVEGQSQDHGIDLSSFASFKAAARPAMKHTDLSPLKLPPTCFTRGPKQVANAEPVSEAPPKGTTFIESPQPFRAAFAPEDLPMASLLAAGVLNRRSTGHGPGPPSGIDPRIEHPRFMSPEPCVSGKSIFGSRWKHGKISRFFPKITEPLGRECDPIVPPTRLSPRTRMLQIKMSERYKASLYQSRLESCEGVSHPDWTQDARGREESRPNLYRWPNPPHWMQAARGHMKEVPKPEKDDRYTKMMSDYTQRFYGSNLDQARDLHHIQRPKQALDLGGLLP